MLQRTLLEDAMLSPAVAKALANPATRMMAAKGIAAMPTPRELVTLLYQTAHVGDAALAAAAAATVGGLPESVLKAAVADVATDPRVLDWAAERAQLMPSLVLVLVSNPSVADATCVTLAARGSEHDVDLIAGNEERLLRYPQIITAMYGNARARMSTVDRAVELAVRRGVRVPELPAWDELVAAIMGGGKKQLTSDEISAQDALFAAAHEAAGELPEHAEETDEVDVEKADIKNVPLNKMTVPMKIRMAMLGNGYMRGLLVRDPVKLVAVAAIKSPKVTDKEAEKYAGNPAICEDVIRYISEKREWVKDYSVKFKLSTNPKTPVTTVTRLLPHLREKDLAIVMRSKGVPSSVVALCRKLITQRRQGDG